MSSSAATPTPIETLLRVKQVAEDGAARAWQAATARRVAAEALQHALDGEVRVAREDLRVRRAAGAVAATAATGEQRERFWGRLRDDIAARAAQAQEHRKG